eukprot:1448261-Rhodomonas_salina.3
MRATRGASPPSRSHRRCASAPVATCSSFASPVHSGPLGAGLRRRRRLTAETSTTSRQSSG